MLPTSNQLGLLYGTAKTHKFDNTADITVDNLKFRPIIAQSGTETYNAGQVNAIISSRYVVIMSISFKTPKNLKK